MRDRREELRLFSEKRLRECIVRTQESALALCREEGGTISRDFAESFDHLMKRTGKKQVKYMVIAFLHSSQLTGSRKYRITLFNSLFYLDPSALSESVRFRFLDSYLEKDIKYLTDFVCSKYKRLTGYEMDALRIECGKGYMDVLGYCFPELLQHIIGLESFHTMEKDPEFKIILGEYMGKGAEVYRIPDNY